MKRKEIPANAVDAPTRRLIHPRLTPTQTLVQTRARPLTQAPVQTLPQAHETANGEGHDKEVRVTIVAPQVLALHVADGIPAPNLPTDDGYPDPCQSCGFTIPVLNL